MSKTVKTYFLVGKKYNEIDESVIDSSISAEEFMGHVHNGVEGYSDLKVVEGTAIITALQLEEGYVPRSCLTPISEAK